MSENKLDEIELRSEEVQEILSKVPHWMIRRGTTLLFFLILLLLILSYIIKYPDIIDSQVLVTTKTPPQKEFANTSGKIDSIYIQEFQSVKKNTVLAILENSAKAKDIYYLKSILDTLPLERGEINFPIDEIPILILGDIETSYANFEDSYAEYDINKVLNPFQNESLSNQLSVNELKSRLRNMQAQYQLNQSELELKQNDMVRQKSLLEKGVISQLDYEQKQLESINVEKGLKNLWSSISQIREAITNANKNVKGTEISRTREESKLLRKTIQAVNQLKKAIKDWENLYALKAEINGKVSFFNYWSSNQTVNQGDLVFTIIPENDLEYIAKVKAAAQNSGKIKVGQNVNIKLQNYPETEFGVLPGKVSSISLSPDSEGTYLIDVSLPQKLITSYNKEIEFRQEMQGSAEIITEDLRLLERFFYQFKSLLDN